MSSLPTILQPDCRFPRPDLRSWPAFLRRSAIPRSASNWCWSSRAFLQINKKEVASYFLLTTEKEVYHEIRRRYNYGGPLTNTCKKSGIGRSTFYSKRFIIEMMETDESTITHLAVQEKRQNTSTSFANKHKTAHLYLIMFTSLLLSP